jgi:hypothetical protein
MPECHILSDVRQGGRCNLCDRMSVQDDIDWVTKCPHGATGQVQLTPVSCTHESLETRVSQNGYLARARKQGFLYPFSHRRPRWRSTTRLSGVAAGSRSTAPCLTSLGPRAGGQRKPQAHQQGRVRVEWPAPGGQGHRGPARVSCLGVCRAVSVPRQLRLPWSPCDDACCASD